MLDNPPDHVTDRALEEWERLSEYMRDKQFDSEEYLVPYAMYCNAVKDYEDMRELINAEGATVQGRNESQVKHPAFTIMKEAAERIQQASRAFGFTPRDQRELDIKKDKEDDEDEFSEEYGF